MKENVSKERYRKSLLSVVLSLAMVFTFLPLSSMTVCAESPTIIVTNQQIPTVAKIGASMPSVSIGDYAVNPDSGATLSYAYVQWYKEDTNGYRTINGVNYSSAYGNTVSSTNYVLMYYFSTSGVTDSTIPVSINGQLYTAYQVYGSYYLPVPVGKLITVQLKDSSDVSTSYDVFQGGSISGLKEKLAAEKAYLGSGLTLTYNGETLSDESTFADANIKAGDVIQYSYTPGNPVCKIGTTEYDNLAAALKNVQDGETITLLSDIELASQTILSGEKSITLDGQNHTISGGGARKGLRVENNASLTMTNVTYDGQNLLYSNGNGGSGGFIELEKASLVLGANTIVKDADLPKTDGVHSIVTLNDLSSLTMEEDSSISNVHGHMSAIRIDSGSVFTMNGGTITDCHTKDASQSQGVVAYLGAGKNGNFDTDTPASFILNGGTIQNCSPQSTNSTYVATGIIYMHPDCCAKVELNGGEIKDCSATYGGAVYSSPKSGVTHTVNVSGSFIAQTNEGSKIDENDPHSKSNIYLGNSSKMTLSGPMTDDGVIGVWTSTVPADAGEGDIQILKYGTSYSGSCTDVAHVVSDKPDTATVIYCDGEHDYYADGTLAKSHHTCSASTNGLWLTACVAYTIKYNLDGGTVSSSNPTTYDAETETFTLNNPAKEGYAFVGWTGSNGTTPELSVSVEKGSSGDRNYTANWEEIITANISDYAGDYYLARCSSETMPSEGNAYYLGDIMMTYVPGYNAFACLVTDDSVDKTVTEAAGNYDTLDEFGDINQNKSINIIDAQIAFDMSTGGYSSEQQGLKWLAADVNQDGKVTAADARAIQCYVHYGRFESGDSSDRKEVDVVTFGSYEQDNDLTNGKEPIEWIVLKKENGKALLLSKYGLECQKFNETDTDVTWETCTLRTWLNSTFLNEAFSSSQQSQIPTTQVENPDTYAGYDSNNNFIQNNTGSGITDLKYQTSGGNATNDKVFLLSIDEAKILLGYDSKTLTDIDGDSYTGYPNMQASATAYVRAKDAGTSSYYKTEEGNFSCWWWMRSPGLSSDNASFIDYCGDVRGNDVINDQGAVRPALWVNLTS